MDSENGNIYFGDMDSIFLDLMSFGEIRNSARRGFGGMRETQNTNSIGAFVHTIILMFMIKGNQTLGIRLGQFR